MKPTTLFAKASVLALILTLCNATTAVSQHVIRVAMTNDKDNTVFTDIRKALQKAQEYAADTLWTDILIEPGVYWVDNPDYPEVLRPKNGGTPYGIELNISRTRITGLGTKPEDVVLACQRGQTQGAVGNFTMMRITGDDVHFENLTMGNYCNVDLVYPLNPSLNRKRRSDAIVQAQLTKCRGDRYSARNVRFVSRLNLCPLSGADHVLFEKCHFESTDDALCGTGVYVGCDFDFYGSKPFYATSQKTGAVMMDCDIRSHAGRVQYLTKAASPVFMIDCRITSDTPDLKLGWTSVPGHKLRCYQSNITLNGKPAMIGNDENTVDITNLPLIRRFKNADGSYITHNLPAPLQLENSELLDSADIEAPRDEYRTITTDEGLEAVVHTHVKPIQLPAPAVLSPLALKSKKTKEGCLYTASYSLDLQGHTDTSDLLWYREYKDGTRIALQMGGMTYTDLNNDDAKAYAIRCQLTPKTNRSWIAPAINLCELLQPEQRPGVWSWCTNKPAGLDEYGWDADKKVSGWSWRKGVDGAAESEGLFTESRGPRLVYTYPFQQRKSKPKTMSATMVVDPCKEIGQGFGSATGQYLDIAIGYDSKSETGYTMRLERVPYHGNKVLMSIVEHRNGTTTAVGEQKATPNFRPGCVITLKLEDGTLTAEVANTLHEAETTVLTQRVAADILSTDFMLQHTGSVGASGVVIKSLKLTYPDATADISCMQRQK